MIAFLCAVAAIGGSICIGNELPDQAWFSQYDLGPTDATIEYRQNIGDIPIDMSKYSGVIAVENCSNIGKEAMIRISGLWHRVIAFDCLARNEHNWMKENNIVAELGYHIARKLNLEERRGTRGVLIWMSS